MNRFNNLLKQIKNSMASVHVNDYTYKEVYYKNITDFNYKMDTSNNVSSPVFKFSYFNEKERISVIFEIDDVFKASLEND